MNNISGDPREQYAQHLKQTLTNCYECEQPKPHSEIIWRGRCRQCCVERLEWAVNNCDCEGRTHLEVYVRLAPLPNGPGEKFVELEDAQGNSLRATSKTDGRYRVIGPLYVSPEENV